MSRLFISLYIAITVGLLAIGWATEQVWQYSQNSTDDEINKLAQLSKTLPLLLTENRATNEQQISQLLSIPVRKLNKEQISIDASSSQLITSGEPLLLYDENNQVTILIQSQYPETYIELGPIALTQESPNLRYSLLLISYLLLAGIILLWTRPLWQDLNKLQHTASQYGEGKLDVNSGVKKSSVIWPLAATFTAMAQQISRLIEEQKQLTNAVSHDLRTPLSRLKFSLAMQPQNEHSEAMQLDVLELEKLVDELLNYARFENQQQKLNIDKVNLSQLLEHLTDKFSRDNPGKASITLKSKVDISCWCDGHLIERAIQNLITNAIRYGNNQVNITLTQDNQSCSISVEDNGEGITEADREKIFNAFTRLDKSRNKASGGFGLGLAIVQRICQWHQGQCNVSASSLGGANFTITLPLQYKE